MPLKRVTRRTSNPRGRRAAQERTPREVGTTMRRTRLEGKSRKDRRESQVGHARREATRGTRGKSQNRKPKGL